MPIGGHDRYSWSMNLALYCSVAEAADIAGVSPAYIRVMAASGRIRGERIGRSWVVLRDDVARFVRIGRGPAKPPAAKKPAKKPHAKRRK